MTTQNRQLERLLRRLELQLGRDFVDVVNNARGEIDLATIADLLESGGLEEALGLLQPHIDRFANATVASILTAATVTEGILQDVAGVNLAFNPTSAFAIQQLQQTRARIVSELTASQREAITSAIIRGIRNGVNPNQQALEFRNVVGLTGRQEQAVQNYRRLLEQRSSAALGRTLRDRRFDRSVRASIEGRRTLTEAQINRMVDRYRERYVRYRGQVIARTEALRSMNIGSDLVYQQAIAEGRLDPNLLIRTWFTAEDERVRSSHDGMNGQERLIGTPFLSDAGNELAFPGDISAPAEETIQCRCVVTTRVQT